MIRKNELKLSIYKKNTISFKFGNLDTHLFERKIHIPTERGLKGESDSTGI